jgi:hypothetical protein
MSLRGGDHALVVNATNICVHPLVSTAKFTAQDNAIEKLQVPMKVKCKKTKGAAKGKRTNRETR